MPNLAALLKIEITRLARRELRASLAQSKRLQAQHRKHIAALRRQIAALEKGLAMLARQAKAKARFTANAEPPKGRFVAKGLVSMRKRLGLSAADLGKLVGVTGQTIYNWEAKKGRPRAAQVEKLKELRGIGKRKVSVLLAA